MSDDAPATDPKLSGTGSESASEPESAAPEADAASAWDAEVRPPEDGQSDPMAPAPPPVLELHREPEPAPRPSAEPVAPGERLASVDVLRGFALLGILAMNIVAFAWPFTVQKYPPLAGGLEGTNFVAWLVNQFVFSGKMMTIFSMLFGAGLVLMADRAATRQASVTGIYYRRVLWLLVIGMIHSYLIWMGDILFEYAACGLVLFLFRRWSPRALILLGSLTILMPVLLLAGLGTGMAFLERSAHRAEAALAAGETPSEGDAAMRDLWRELLSEFQPTPEKLNEEIAIYRGGYLGILQHRVPQVLAKHTVGFVFFLFWLIGGRMLLGMGLMKLGVFAAQRSTRLYTLMVLLGYGTGVPLTALAVQQMIAREFSMVAAFQIEMPLIFLASVPVALGHVGVVMLVCKAGVLTWLTGRLAAVGRMALTNYLMHSIICTTLFYGYGFALFGRLDRTELWGVVLAIWVFQLLVSPLWLRSYRFGPAEWLWRSLTYGKPQPMRYPTAPAV